MRRALMLLLTLLALALPASGEREKVRIGSKAFLESWVLGEALCQLAQGSGAEVDYRGNLGATQIIFEALRSGSIDVYPEYTGTVKEVFLKHLEKPSDNDVLTTLARQGIGVSYPLGFTNSYALAVRKDVEGIETLTQLAQHPELTIALNQEFVGRKDGWSGLAPHYGFKPKNLLQMQHDLAYTAVQSGKVDVINVYTTDAQIGKLGLKLLRDDKAFFPRYEAVLLYRADLPQRAPQAWAAMLSLVGRINEGAMSRANAAVMVEKKSNAEAARQLLADCLPPTTQLSAPQASSMWADMAVNLRRHLELVAISLTCAILVGIPLGVLASSTPALASLTLSGTGLLQTIPSLALLAFLVPLTGVGPKPALVALFVYSLLPIVRNTYTGLTTIPGNLSEAAEAIGLSPRAQLLWVRLPMASPAILAGIKTSAVINVGTATLAALVGAGGLGQPILQGINLQNMDVVLQGALPSAALALLVQWAFDLIERAVVPRGLRL